MSENIPVEIPTVGESISEVQIGAWLKQDGDWVDSGEDLVEIETEKASVQIPSPASGFLTDILKQTEEFAAVGDQIASIREGKRPDSAGEESGSSRADSQQTEPNGDSSAPKATTPQQARSESTAPQPSSSARPRAGGFVMPAAQRLLDEHQLNAADVPATGPGGRLLKEDVLAYVRSGSSRTQQPSTSPQSASPQSASPQPASPQPAHAPSSAASPQQAASALTHSYESQSLITEGAYRSEEVKPMSMLRRTIASRLVQAQQTAALLTTFNEINMQPVMQIRSKYKDAFAKKHGVKLGFMSFFAKAAVEALRRFPAVNAEIRGDSIVYRNYQDIGIAIGGGKGLVVPVLRNVEGMSFSQVEGSIAEYARLAGENRLQPADLMGGTFTISNGGIYGSLLSTPIVNPPQSGILGLHAIKERPIAEDGQVVIRPMMYIALTYDHRVVDGREAVGFLVAIKDLVEDPSRLFLEV